MGSGVALLFCFDFLIFVEVEKKMEKKERKEERAKFSLFSSPSYPAGASCETKRSHMPRPGFLCGSLSACCDCLGEKRERESLMRERKKQKRESDRRRKSKKKTKTYLGRRRKHHRHRQSPQCLVHQVHPRRLLPRVLAIKSATDGPLVREDGEVLPAVGGGAEEVRDVATEKDEISGLGRAEVPLAAPRGALEDEGAILGWCWDSWLGEKRRISR